MGTGGSLSLCILAQHYITFKKEGPPSFSITLSLTPPPTAVTASLAQCSIDLDRGIVTISRQRSRLSTQDNGEEGAKGAEGVFQGVRPSQTNAMDMIDHLSHLYLNYYA